MNLKWVIIGTIFIVLLVAFGRNPVQEAREQRRKEIDEKGVLVYEIEKHLEDQNTGIGGMQPRQPRPMTRTLPPSLNPQQQDTLPEPEAMTPPPDGTQPTQPQGYYPPPPKPESNIPIFDPTKTTASLRGDELMWLPSNVQLQYRATRVYTKASDGVVRPVPDGNYVIADGLLVMEVLDGERTRIRTRVGY
ncbi:MAG: hypothetical protein SFW63_02915 [Alphaproteobacteria bacterium]|nr:hypothetical protein [Alphaproteobacteria bacterium]